MLELDDLQIMKEIPIILKAETLIYFSAGSAECTSYLDATNLLRQW